MCIQKLSQSLIWGKVFKTLCCSSLVDYFNRVYKMFKCCGWCDYDRVKNNFLHIIYLNLLQYVVNTLTNTNIWAHIHLRAMQFNIVDPAMNGKGIIQVRFGFFFVCKNVCSWKMWSHWNIKHLLCTHRFSIIRVKSHIPVIDLCIVIIS